MAEFMVPIANFDKWYRLSNHDIGEEFLLPAVVINDQIDTFINSKIKSFSVDYKGEGYCVRFSAPGYMDATEWEGVYKSEEEAILELFYNWDSADYSLREWCEKYGMDFNWLNKADK